MVRPLPPEFEHLRDDAMVVYGVLEAEGERPYLPYPGGDRIGGYAAAIRTVEPNAHLGWKVVPLRLVPVEVYAALGVPPHFQRKPRNDVAVTMEAVARALRSGETVDVIYPEGKTIRLTPVGISAVVNERQLPLFTITDELQEAPDVPEAPEDVRPETEPPRGPLRRPDWLGW